MTKIHKLFTLYNVHSHKEQQALTDLLENHLPNPYTFKVQEKLKEEGREVSSGSIRNVKIGHAKDVQIFNAIIEVAKESKIIDEKLKANLKTAV